ncbi:hypothetical protein ABG067_000334 [Albugo candida]
MPIALVRVEELEEWISQVTGQDIRNEHLSVTLQNGQVLCQLVNALDGSAKLRVNRLTTVFHSKSNINLFLDWCRAQGLSDVELFETNDLLETREFERVIVTLSVLYEQYDGVRYSLACTTAKSPLNSTEDNDDNSSCFEDEFDEDLTRTQYISKASSKLSSFVKGNFLSVKKKKGKLFSRSASQEQGTPIGTPPPSTPCPEDEIDLEDKPKTPAATTNRKNRTNSKLEIFLEQAPPANAIASEQSKRPTPARKKSSAKEQSLPVPESTQPQSKKLSQSMKGLRAKASPFASFSNKDNRKKLSGYIKNNSLGGASSTSKQTSKPEESAATSKTSVKDGKSINSIKQVSVGINRQVEERDESSHRKKPDAPTKTSKATKNNLKEFIAKQPPVIPTSPQVPRTQSSKLAAFLAITEKSPKGGTTPETQFASSPNVPPRQNIPISTFSASQRVNNSTAPTISPRNRVRRSTRKGNYVRKRQTYWIPEKRQATFSLENKRRRFMEEQLKMKDEQLRNSSGDTMKQNLIVPGVHCYVPDDEDVWLPAQVVEYDQKYHQVNVEVTLDDGEVETRHINLNNRDVIRSIAGPNATSVESLPIAIQHDNTNGVEDMRLLRFLNEPSILFNLKKRFESSQPYTYSTDIVIALNPYKWIDNLYGHDTHAQYLKMDRDKLTPHVYATSSAAYKHMIEFETNQSILATCIQKIVLGYLERRRLERKISAAIQIQSVMRMRLERMEFKLQRRAIVSIQRCWRRFLMIPGAPENDSIVESPGQIEENESRGTDDVRSSKLFEEDVVDDVFDDPATEGSDVSYESSNGPATPPRKGKSLKDRFINMRQKVNIVDDFSSMRNLRANSVKRMGELTDSAQRMLDGLEGQKNSVSLEEENAMLRAENQNLQYDLEMMREQCIELQSIIVEINRSRKRFQ